MTENLGERLYVHAAFEGAGGESMPQGMEALVRNFYVILHDKRYTGVVTHKGEEYYNIFPPIITKEVWSQVNAINEESFS